MPGDMFVDETGDEEIAVVVARAPTQLQRMPGLLRGVFQQLRFELLTQEIVGLTLINQDRVLAAPRSISRLLS